MIRTFVLGTALAGGLLINAAAFAQNSTLASGMGVYISPAKGQSPEQMSQDDLACFNEAKSQTGYDPMNKAQAQKVEAGSSTGGGERVGGAAKGALVGTAVGAIAGDTGKGAAIGGTLGLVSGGAKARNNAQAKANQQNQQAQAQVSQMETNWKNAYSACIEARGYAARF